MTMMNTDDSTILTAATSDAENTKEAGSKRSNALLQGSNASTIRSRLIHKLGIPPSTQGLTSSANDKTKLIPHKHDDGYVLETLKGDYGQPAVNNPDEDVDEDKDKDKDNAVEIQCDSRRGDDTVATESSGGGSTSTSSIASGESTSCEEDELDNIQGMDDASQTGKPRKNVSFEPSVKVHSIPHHNLYSNRIRSTIWTSPEELEHHAARNTLEFTAENWDWRQVHEEKDMVWYKGQPIHRVHFMLQFPDQMEEHQQKESS